MKKCFLIISIYLSLCLSVFASTKISIFIDISGSMYNSLPQIQEYLNNEYIPALETDTEVNIYKFYGKLITPPIYAGNLKNETNVRWAKKRINALKANGPWTNINAVFEYIKENCINYGDKFIVLTDCNNETEDGNNNYKFTDSMIKDKLDANISILPKGNWKVIEYTYEKPAPAIDKTQLNNETESANIIHQDKTGIKINWRVLLLIILIIIVFLFSIFIMPKILKYFWFNLKSIHSAEVVGISMKTKKITSENIISNEFMVKKSDIDSITDGLNSEQRENLLKAANDGAVNPQTLNKEREHYNESKEMDVDSKIEKLKQEGREKLKKIDIRKLTEEERNSLKLSSSKENAKKTILKVLQKYRYDDDCMPLFLEMLLAAEDQKSIELLDEGGVSWGHILIQEHSRHGGGNHEYIGTENWWHFADHRYNNKLSPEDNYALLKLTPQWASNTKAIVFKDGKCHPQGSYRSQYLSPMSQLYHNSSTTDANECISASDYISKCRKRNKEYLSKASYEASEAKLYDVLEKI